MATTKPRRAVCPDCLRPERTCICTLAVPVEHATEVLILQHPLEVREAKGTARLLHRCLPRSRIIVGEQFDVEELHALLYHAWPHAHSAGRDVRPVQPVLLYPETVSPHASEVTGIEQKACAGTSRQCRLVILDGTWRKSRKMLHRNPLLATLPRLSLTDTQVSAYLIRKAHRPEQLSTLEAACHALMQLEQDSERFQPVLHAFARFVAQRMHYAQALP